MFRVVIPARYASVRLPGKILLSVAGKPMIQWVYERARASQAREVLIATDDPLIVNAAHAFGAEALMTAPSHRSGTDRIAEVAQMRGWTDSDIVINVQGDEPLIPPALIDQVGSMLQSNPSAQIATLASAIRSISEFMDPNAVKVVTDVEGRALYFSRAPIPWDRDGASSGVNDQKSFSGARRHVGIYGYRVGGLLRLAALEPSPLERLERLEQLRALENGFEIRVADSVVPPGPDVNTAADLERVSVLLRQ
jgi:3-deoxy-manno-octulosonate cytidylyltransferase (CMP-KDO synthetase)